MGPQAVIDTGPLLHLHEIGALKALRMIATCTTTDVQEELRTCAVPSQTMIMRVPPDKTSFFMMHYDIGIGEASCLALCKQKKISVLFTDDLTARAVAKMENIEPHGTIGILIGACKKSIFTKKQTLVYLGKLSTKSTIFITQKLINEAMSSVAHIKTR